LARCRIVVDYWQEPSGWQSALGSQQSLSTAQPTVPVSTQPQRLSPAQMLRPSGPGQHSLSVVQGSRSAVQAPAQTPPTQLSEAEQVMPQPPQSKSSFAVSTQMPPQSTVPPVHEMVTVHAVDDDTAASPNASAAPTASLRKDEAVD